MKTHLSLFSGIGGLDLAAEAAGFTTVGQCEWADYPTKVLEKHWPDVPRWRDIRTLTGESFYERTGLRTVDVISGGFPCQPFSVAGERKGKDDDRYLWPEMLRVIQEIRPTWVLGENVPGIINLALDQVLSSLENIGYACEAFLIPACGVDAPHRRFRICILAHSDDRYGDKQKKAVCTRRNSVSLCGYNVADAKSIGRNYGDDGENEREAVGKINALANTSTLRRKAIKECRGIIGKHYWTPEPSVGRVVDGISNRVDRLRCLGNAVVPQQFYPFFMGIAKIMNEMEEKEK